MFLLDTNVISELRRVRPHRAVVAWLSGVSDEALHISAVTIGEIQSGIELARENDPAKAAEIEEWLDQVVRAYNVVPMDVRAGRIWGRLKHRLPLNQTADAMIAATAISLGLTVVTRNRRDFEAFGVPILDPFEPN
ncbi:MAG: type II toxin-antitoxin system VapC family toxin [Caulobacteraceae bacterium]